MKKTPEVIEKRYIFSNFMTSTSTRTFVSNHRNVKYGPFFFCFCSHVFDLFTFIRLLERELNFQTIIYAI